MSEPLFNIVFYGIIQPDKDRDTVLQNMASMFKTEPAKLAPYFAGGRKVIKSNVDELVAEGRELSVALFWRQRWIDENDVGHVLNLPVFPRGK